MGRSLLFITLLLSISVVSGFADPRDEAGPLSRMVSYFSGDLQRIDDELAQLKPFLAMPPIPPGAPAPVAGGPSNSFRTSPNFPSWIRDSSDSISFVPNSPV